MSWFVLVLVLFVLALITERNAVQHLRAMHARFSAPRSPPPSRLDRCPLTGATAFAFAALLIVWITAP